MWGGGGGGGGRGGWVGGEGGSNKGSIREIPEDEVMTIYLQCEGLRDAGHL